MEGIPKSGKICPLRAKLVELIEQNLDAAALRMEAAELEESLPESYETDAYWKKKKRKKKKCGSGKSSK